MRKIILVDDDTDLGDLITSSLIIEGYDVHYKSTLAGIENIIKSFHPSILILDVEIGFDDGISKAKSILQKFPLLPILFISSHTETSDVTRGIIAGGVGYIRKPFDIPELQAYIERFAMFVNLDDSITEIGLYTLNKKTRELHLGGILVKQLSHIEFNLLQLLLDSDKDIVCHETISNKIWGKQHIEVEHTLNNVIYKLRKVLNHDEKVNLQTIKEVGYRLIF